jgi:hypothetical protein
LFLRFVQDNHTTGIFLIAPVLQNAANLSVHQAYLSQRLLDKGSVIKDYRTPQMA